MSLRKDMNVLEAVHKNSLIPAIDRYSDAKRLDKPGFNSIGFRRLKKYLIAMQDPEGF